MKNKKEIEDIAKADAMLADPKLAKQLKAEFPAFLKSCQIDSEYGGLSQEFIEERISSFSLERMKAVARGLNVMDPGLGDAFIEDFKKLKAKNNQ
jgi:hypothetical protein